MSRLVLSLLLAGALAARAAAAPASAAATKLVGTVGPGATITLKKDGKLVTTLKPGKYSLVVTDRATFHNFRLKGPGVNVATSVPATGTRTFAVTLVKGTYTIVCDPHKGTMKRTLTVR